GGGGARRGRRGGGRGGAAPRHSDRVVVEASGDRTAIDLEAGQARRRQSLRVWGGFGVGSTAIDVPRSLGLAGGRCDQWEQHHQRQQGGYGGPSGGGTHRPQPPPPIAPMQSVGRP